jgi:hypothetical protein
VSERKTGLGLDAFFPKEEEAKPVKKETPESEAPASGKRKTARKSKPKTTESKRTQTKKLQSQRVVENAESNSPPRRTAWLREDHLDRLEVLKIRDRERLRTDPDKRVAVTTLIDEAIERYLSEMEN